MFQCFESSRAHAVSGQGDMYSLHVAMAHVGVQMKECWEAGWQAATKARPSVFWITLIC